MIGDVTVSNDSLVSDWESKDIAFALVVSQPGTDAEALKRAEDTALKRFPTAKPQTIQDFKDEQNKGVNGLRRRWSTRCWRCR